MSIHPIAPVEHAVDFENITVGIGPLPVSTRDKAKDW